MRFLFSIPFLILITLSAFGADEKDCSPVRLDQNGGPFQFIPIYDQHSFANVGDTGICYAVSAAELIDAYRYRQEGKPPELLTAPISIALNTRIKTMKWNEVEVVQDGRVEEIMGLAEIHRALGLARRQSVCDQNWLDRFDGTIAAKSPAAAELPPEIAKLLPSKKNFLRAVTAEIERLRAKPLPFLAGLRGLRPRAELSEDFFACRLEENTLPLKDLLAAVEAGAEEATPLAQMNAFLKSVCASHSFRLKIPEPQELVRSTLARPGDLDMEAYRTGELEKKAHAIIGNPAKPKPLAVNFCYSALEKKGAGGINDDRLGFFHARNCVLHSAVIIGRKFNRERKSCELLVRDSYGNGCRNADGGERYDWPCENGNVWIDSTQLMRSAVQLIWL
jgi:hypothetical protein